MQTSRVTLTSCNECVLLLGFPYREWQSFRIGQTYQTNQHFLLLAKVLKHFLSKAAEEDRAALRVYSQRPCFQI